MDPRTILQITDSSAYLAHFEPRKGELHRVALETCALTGLTLPREADDLTPLAEQLGRWLRDVYRDGLACRLVIPSNWCLMQAVQIDAERWSDDAALFEFERYVPAELEQLTCCVQRIDRHRALVVGVFTAAIQAFFDRLERHNVVIEDATVDLMHLQPEKRSTKNGAKDGVALIDARRVTLAGLEGGACSCGSVRVIARPEGECPEALLRHLATARAAFGLAPGQWRTYCLSEDAGAQEIVRALRNGDASAAVPQQEQALDRLLAAAAASGDPFDLRRGVLAHTGRWSPLRRRASQVAAALAAVLIAVSVGARIDNMAYGRAIAKLRAVKAGLYQEVFPRGAVPPAAALRLTSERNRLEGVTDGTRQGSFKLERNGIEILFRLSRLVEQMPADVRLRIDEMAIDRRGVKLIGCTKAHSDAGRLVQAFNKIPTLEADPPRTKLRSDRTIDFRIQAKRTGDDRTE